jgi:hypothetical protein
MFGFLLAFSLFSAYAKAAIVFNDMFTDGDYTNNPTWTTGATVFGVNSTDGYYNTLEESYEHPGGGLTIAGMIQSSISLNSSSNFTVSYLLNTTNNNCFGSGCTYYLHRLGLMNATGDGYLVEYGGTTADYNTLNFTKNITGSKTNLISASGVNDFLFHNITIRRNATHYAVFYDNAEKGSTTDISSASGNFVNIWVGGTTKDAGGTHPTYFWENITVFNETAGGGGPANDGPQYSNEDANYDSPTIYTPGRNFGFQTTWNWIQDNDNATLRANFSGSFQNYTVSNTGNTTYANFTQEQFKGAYGYQYKWYATNGTYNETDWIDYTISKNSSSVSVQSSLGWSLLQGSTTVITCISGQTAILTFDGAVVGAPYTAQPAIGVYDVQCDITATENYTGTASQTLIVSPLIACMDSTTFGFEKNITTATAMTTLNFTDIVATKYAKADLSDVYVPNVTAVQKNATSGYYLIVNNTGTDRFTVRFGSYVFNGNYSINSTANVISMTGYTQINPIATVNLLDELTGEPSYPPNSTIIVIAHCSRGENYIVLSSTNDTSVLFAGKSYFDRIAVRVKYTADMYYSRQLYISQSDSAVLNIYTVDAYEHALDRIDFHMLDSNYYSTKLQVYKLIENTAMIITEGYFDASHYFSAYLMEDSEYYIQAVSATGSVTQFGSIVVVTPAQKDLSKSAMNLNPEAVLISNKIFMNAWMSDDRKTVYVSYSDALNQTQSINISVYFGNGTKFQSINYTNATTTNAIDLSYDTTGYENESFTVTFRVQHGILGNSPVQYMMSLISPFTLSLGIAAIWYQLFSIGIVLFTGGLMTRKSLIAGMMFTMIIMIVLWGINWLQIPTVFIAFAAVLCMLGVIAYMKQGGE